MQFAESSLQDVFSNSAARRGEARDEQSAQQFCFVSGDGEEGFNGERHLIFMRRHNWAVRNISRDTIDSLTKEQAEESVKGFLFWENAQRIRT